jgi:cell division protein FtsI (penicillin-binding protein 3)
VTAPTLGRFRPRPTPPRPPAGRPLTARPPGARRVPAPAPPRSPARFPPPPRRPAAASRAGPRRRAVRPAADVRNRLIALLVVLALAFTAVVVRLGMVQGPGGRRFALVGLNQRLRSAALPAERGAIVDRNGEPLAMSSQRRTVWADPQAVRDPAGAARALAGVLHQSQSSIRDRLTGPGSFVYLARKVDDSVADSVKALHLSGVSLLDEPKRVDPAGSLALPVLGQVGLDDQGLSGLELQYQKDLAGRAGELVVEKDPAGRDIAAGIHEIKAAAPGDRVELTLDRSMQFETERVLGEQISSAHAKGGIAVVMDPISGDILAMANLSAGANGGPPVPAADNMAVTRVYEPGSVNKMITMAAAIQEGVVRPEDTFVVPPTIKVAGSTFHDAEGHPTESMTVTRILADSSNVGTIMIGQRLGKTRLDHYLRAFGLASHTTLAFPGESGGLLPDPSTWSGTSMATMPIGQGVAVTALQMLSAYNTIANGGMQVTPRLVKRVVDAGGKAHDVKRPAPRRVVSQATVGALVPMLEQVVKDGTAPAAAVEGYRVAGKTGTAEKVRDDGRGYQAGAYLATFAGFLPASAPRLSAIVVLDEPTPIYGGLVAAPVFSDVAGFGARLLAIAPDAPGDPGPSPTSSPGAAAFPAPTGPATTAAPRRPATTLVPTPTSRP